MATYRFTLRHPDGVETFGTEYVHNWEDIGTSFTENDTYKGLLREFSNTFEFTGFVRDRFVSLIDKYGYDVAVFVLIEKGNDNKEQWSFKPYSDELKADIQGADIDELAAKINFADNEFTAKILARHDTKVNLDVTKSIDGDETGNLGYSEINLHDRSLVKNSRLENIDDFQEYIRPETFNDDAVLTIPFTVNYRSDDNWKDILLYKGKTLDFGSNAVYLNNDEAKTIDLKINLDGIFRFKLGAFLGRLGFEIVLVKVKETDSNDFLSRPPAIHYFASTVGWGVGPEDQPLILQGENNVTLSSFYEGSVFIDIGESLQIVFRATSLRWAEIISYTGIDTYIDAVYLSPYPATKNKCLLPHEYFERLVQIGTGQNNRFYSEFFGRTDLGYAADGAGAYLTVQNGRMIRNFPAADFQLNSSLKEAFQSFDSVYCLCATIEKRNNVDVFRVEPYETFRNMNVVIELGKFTNNIRRKVNPKRVIQDIVVGYKDQEYEEINGTFQYNGEVNYSSPITTEGAKLDAMCKYRADDIGIELTRRLQFADDPSKDYRSDKDIFLITAKKTGNELTALTNEGFTAITGIYEPAKAYNLDITPGRNLRRWGSYIRAGLIGIEDRRLKFVKGASNSALLTQKTGEQKAVDEDADILISDLSNPIEYAETITIAEAAITDNDLTTLEANRGGLVKFKSGGVDLFGRVSECEFDANKKIANFELNRAYGI